MSIVFGILFLFAIYEATEARGLDRVLWGTLGMTFGVYALALVVSVK